MINPKQLAKTSLILLEEGILAILFIEQSELKPKEIGNRLGIERSYHFEGRPILLLEVCYTSLRGKDELSVTGLPTLNGDLRKVKEGNGIRFSPHHFLENSRRITPMQNLVPIQNTDTLQLTNEDKLRIGVAWDALSSNSRRAYNWRGDNLMNFYLLKAKLWIISRIHNWQPTSQL